MPPLQPVVPISTNLGVSRTAPFVRPREKSSYIGTSEAGHIQFANDCILPMSQNDSSGLFVDSGLKSSRFHVHRRSEISALSRPYNPGPRGFRPGLERPGRLAWWQRLPNRVVADRPRFGYYS